MFKNIGSQKVIVFAFDSTTNLPKTGDAANLTAYVSKDYGTVTVLGDTSATEMDATNAKGYYLFDLTQAETNGDTLLFSAKSATANIVVVGAPATVFTDPPSYTSFVTPTGATVAAVTGAVGSVTGAVGSVTGAVGSVTARVTANTDQIEGVDATNQIRDSILSDATRFAGADIDATISSRSTYAGGAVASVTGNVGGNVTGTVGSVVGAVGSVTGNVGGSVASVVAAVATTSNIKTNQALAKFQFLMTDSTNHNPSTGLTVTVTRSIDGGAYAAGTLSAVTEVASGTYSVDFGAGDLNGKVIILKATAAASDTTFERIVTQP